MKTETGRFWAAFPAGYCLAGALLLVFGVWMAGSYLPEWEVPRRPSRETLQGILSALQSSGAAPENSELRLRRSPLYPHLYERAFRQLGSEAREYIARTAGFSAWVLSVDLPLGKGALGQAHVALDSRGTIRRLDWKAGGVLALVRDPSEEDRQIRDVFVARFLGVLTGAGTRGAESSVMEPGGNAINRVWPVTGRPGEPAEWVTQTVAGSNMIIVGRELAQAGSSQRSGQSYFSRALVVAALLGFLVIVVLAILGVLLFKRRLSFRIAVWLGGLSFGTAILSGSAIDSMLRQGGVIAVVFLLGGLAIAAFLVAFWAVSESLLRDSVPGFATSLDALIAGRLGPRSARALLAGLGLGAALAGTRFLLFSFAASRPSDGIFPVAASFNFPFFAFLANPFTEGAFQASAFVFLAAVSRRFLAKEKADPAAFAVVALTSSAALPLMPWGASLILFLVEAIVLLLAFRKFGLTGLLVTAISAGLFRDLSASFVYLPHALLPFVIAAVSLAFVAVIGVAALGRGAGVEEGRVEGPEYVRKLEQERRVTYEMGLLSRMQLALLPERPPQIKGLDLAARTLIATEAGGDLYDFIPDEDGFLWVAAGDVAGHGYSCGIQQAMVKASLLSLIKAGRRPAEVLGEVHRVLRMVGKHRLFTSLVLLRIDPRTGTGLLANAGHPYPLKVFEGRCEEIAVPGLPLGQGPPREYSDVEVSLEEGASFVLASDGLFEGTDRTETPYGYSRAQAVLEAVGLWRRPAEGILDALFADLSLHTQGARLADDTTLVVVKRSSLSW